VTVRTIPRGAVYRQDGKRLRELLVETRQRGYAINDEESRKGVRAIAVPIFSAGGAAYAVNLVVPPEEVTVDKLRRDMRQSLLRWKGNI